MQASIIATIQSGKPKLSEYQREKLNKVFQANEGKVIQITAGEIKKDRSGQQNKYLWGVVYKLLAEHTGYSEEEMHEVLKYKFLPRKHVNLDGEDIEIRKSTSKLSTVEFEAYIERIRAFAAEELQITIPSPNES